MRLSAEKDPETNGNRELRELYRGAGATKSGPGRSARRPNGNRKLRQLYPVAGTRDGVIVTPAKAGVQTGRESGLDTGLRRYDGKPNGTRELRELYLAPTPKPRPISPYLRTVGSCSRREGEAIRRPIFPYFRVPRRWPARLPPRATSFLPGTGRGTMRSMVEGLAQPSDAALPPGL